MIANKLLAFDKNKTKFYDFGYEEYLEKKIEEPVLDEVKEKKEKKA